MNRTYLALVGATLGLVIGLFMAVLLGGIMATDPAPPADTSGLEQDLAGLQTELDSLTRSLADSQGRLDSSSQAYCATVALVDGLQGQLDSMTRDMQGLLVMMGDQDDRLNAIGADLESAQAELDRTLSDLLEARLQLSYAQGRLNGSQVFVNVSYPQQGTNGSQVFVNLSLDQMAAVMAQLSGVIAQLAETQQQLSDAIADLIASRGGEPPKGLALPSPHLTHFQSPVIDFECRMCHNMNVPGNLTVYGSQLYFGGNLTGTGFVVQMNRTLVCSKCHNVFPTKMPSSYKTRDCTVKDCHEQWRDEMKSPYVNEANVTKDNCLLCHGGQPYYPR